ncbi:MAG: tRNA-dihydrouridine synthase, partial [Selenomonas bovis]|nr:tRNA-dihydrouridine synthase [Selenomonas bovis]
RMGWDEEHINVVELARRAEAAGVDAIAVHGRTREQFYRGKADWDIIRCVKEAVRVPVIANGDVRTYDDLDAIREATGCDAVMIGRAAQGNPWIFRQLTHYLRTGERLPAPTLQERAAVLLRHLDLLLKYKGDYVGPREMRKHATWYTRGIVHGAILRDRFNKAATREDFVAILREYFDYDA